MRNMSFALTTEQVKAQTKFVTRRFGWWFLKPGDIVQPVEKAMGLKKGESIVKLGSPIEVVEAYGEPLNEITQLDVILEGFPTWTPDQFVEFLVRKYRCNPSATVNRIAFKYIKTDGEQ
jgi:hypothetical protein